MCYWYEEGITNIEQGIPNDEGNGERKKFPRLFKEGTFVAQQ
jgi:hypothetical protein